MKKNTNKWTLGVLSIMSIGILFSACSKKSGTTIAPPEPLGGYVSSDSVASANLIAYWPFDGNANDVKGGLSGTATGVTYTTGIRGQAYQGSTSGAIQVPLTSSSAFANLQSFTVSLWYNDPVQVTSPNHGLFHMYGPADWNLLEIEFERDSTSTGDSVRLHAGFTNPGGVDYKGIVPESLMDSAIGKWVNIAMTYDGGSSMYTIYQNGVPIGAKTAWSNGAYAPTPTEIWTDGTATTPMGNLNFSSEVPTGITIGAFPPSITAGNSWAGSFPGMLDELRVYNKALTSAEVKGLYLNGKAGR